MGKNDEARHLAETINKEYGEGAVVLASDMRIPKRFTSGSLSLDVSIGGGWPANQWVEIYGPENHGKTAIAYKTIAANQRVDPDFMTLWVAAEHYDVDQAEALGVDNSRVYLLPTQDMAYAYAQVCDWLERRACDCVVIDSYPALIPPDEDEKQMDEDARISEGAKLTNKFFRKVGKAGLRNPLDPEDRPWLGIFINQPREKPGAWAPHGQVAETTPGGRGKNFAFYCRLQVKRAEFISVGPKDGKRMVGQVIRTQAIKNKGGPPMRVSSIDFFFTDCEKDGTQFKRGDYDVVKDVLTVAVLFDVIRRGGAWYRYGDLKWNGLKKVLEDVRENPDLLKEIEEKTREAASRPEDKRTWDEEAVISASTAMTPLRRRKRDSDED